MKFGKHFDIWEWVDFVRHTGDPAKSSAMKAHLSAGCRRCERLVRVLEDFARRAPNAARHEPPAHVVRRAEAIFPARRAESTLVGRLIYDSFREPLPAGMRAHGQVARHALYEAGDLFVDLQLEQTPSGTMSLLGQISDRERPQGAAAAPTPVLLTSGRVLVASAVCNLLGEFELTYKPARDVRLHVPLPHAGGHVELRMDELVHASPGGTRKPR
jgi:hypothetical protein